MRGYEGGYEGGGEGGGERLKRAVYYTIIRCVKCC